VIRQNNQPDNPPSPGPTATVTGWGYREDPSASLEGSVQKMKSKGINSAKEGIQSMIFSGIMRILIVLVILLPVVCVPVTADVIDPNNPGGYHNMYEPQLTERCYRIENANEYPGYIIGVAPYPNQSDGFVSFDTKRCFLGNFGNVTRDSQIYAMQETDYYQLKRENPEHITYRTAIPSGYPAPLRSNTYVFYSLPQNETDVLSIVTLDNSHFILNTTRSYKIFENGEMNELPVLEPTLLETTPMSPIPVPSPESGTAVSLTLTSVPVPRDNRTTNDENPLITYQYFILPLLALCVIAAILIKRSRK
jgi:hypothetical protein